MSRPRRWASAGLAAFGVLLFAAGTLLAVQGYRAADSPAAVVTGYFGALARGDAGAALAYGALPAGGRQLLTAPVLAGQRAAGPIRDVGVTSVRRDSDVAATVGVRYSLGTDVAEVAPVPVADEIALVRSGGRWRLTRTAVAVTVSVADAPAWAAVAGPTPFGVPDGVQLVFPGAVPVVYRASSLMVAAGAARAVRFAGPTQVVVTASPTPAATRAVTRTVRAALLACVQGPADVDPFCPQPGPTTTGVATFAPVPRSLHGELGAADSLHLTIAVGTASDSGLSVDGQVMANGSWQTLDFDNVAHTQQGPVTLSFEAEVPFDQLTSLTWARSSV